MGDLVEITTVPNQQDIFYRVTSGAITFYVRGPGNAGISLAKKPEKACCDILIGLGLRGSTWISKNDEQVVAVPTPNVMSGGQFKGFWLQWCDDKISLGREYESEPFISYEHKTSDLKYISFKVIGPHGHSLQWKFEMPPLRDKLKIKPVSGGLPQWVEHANAYSQLPDGAVIGGFEKETLYIIRAKHEGSLTPGKFVPSEGVGYIPFSGDVYKKKKIEVLCGYNCIWIPASNRVVPLGAVEGGWAARTAETLYVGRAMWNDELIPGKVVPSHQVCYIPYGDREIAMKVYEILVVPDKNTQCLNSFFMHELYQHQPSCEVSDNENDQTENYTHEE